MPTTEITEAAAHLAALKAADKAARDRTATQIAKTVVKALPETEFKTGSKGHSIRGNVTLPGGRKAFVNVLVVYSDTVVKDQATT